MKQRRAKAALPRSFERKRELDAVRSSRQAGDGHRIEEQVIQDSDGSVPGSRARVVFLGFFEAGIVSVAPGAVSIDPATLRHGRASRVQTRSSIVLSDSVDVLSVQRQ